MKPTIGLLSATFRLRLAPILFALVAGHSVPAVAANDSFAEAIDLGVATEWDASGREFVGTIEEKEGEDQQFFRFRIQESGPSGCGRAAASIQVSVSSTP